MLYIFAMKSAIKERHHSKYHHQMVFHITVPSNILTDMTRMPLGTFDIKFRNSKMFIHRNRLNRYMSYKLKYTNQTVLYAFDIYQQIFLIKREIDIFIFLPHISYTDTVLTVFDNGTKTRLNWLAKSALFIRFKPSFQYSSYRNEPITVCGFIH